MPEVSTHEITREQSKNGKACQYASHYLLSLASAHAICSMLYLLFRLQIDVTAHFVFNIGLIQMVAITAGAGGTTLHCL